MTVLGLLGVLGIVAVLSVTSMVIVPKMRSAKFSNEVFTLLHQLEDDLDRGALPAHPYVLGLRRTTYRIASDPDWLNLTGFAALAAAVGNDRPVNQLEQRFVSTATAAERALIDHFDQRMATLVAKQLLDNSPAWLPLQILVRLSPQAEKRAERTADWAMQPA